MYGAFLHLFLLIFGVADKVDHPIHISRTEVNFSTRDKEIQIAAKIYIDDFELAIKQNTNKELKIFTPEERFDADKVIEEYITQKLNIVLDGKLAKFTIQGKESSEDHLAVWVYLSTKAASVPTSITIECRYLYEIYNDQKNMIDVTVDGRKKKFLVLDTKQYRESFIL